MQNAYNSHSKTVGELLGPNEAARLVVPQFQRGYSWETRHVEAFYKDITRHQRESELKDGPDKYFLGPIVTLQEDGSKDVIQVLDGQQRLATATIWFSVIRDIARGIHKQHGISAGGDFARDTQRDFISKDDSAFALELGEMDRVYFAQTVQGDPPLEKTPMLRSHRNIQKARQFLRDSMQAFLGSADPMQRLALLKKMQVTLRRELVVAVIPVDDQRDAFRIFETLNDRGLRLSVPDLLLNYLMGQAKPATDRQQIRDCWNDMLDQMGTHDINRFLRHMWVSKYGDLKDQDLFSALKGHIEKNSTGSLEFAKTCADECTRYAQLLDVDDQLGVAATHVWNLLHRLNVQAAFPLLLSAYGRFKPDDFAKITKWLLVYVTRYSIVANLDSSGMETVLFKLARDVREKVTDEKAASGCMAYIRETLTKSAPSDEKVRQAAADLTLGSNEAKYLLGRLATHMQTKTKEVAINEANIEHIFPKGPNQAEWPNKDELSQYLWHIGNLTVLGKRLNTEAANRGFAFKRTEFYHQSELTMTQKVAAGYTKWNNGAVKKRAKDLAPLVVQIWNFDNPSRV